MGLNFDSITIHLLTGAIAVVYSPKVESICNLLSVMILLAAWCKYPLVWKVTRGPVWARWYSLLGVSIVIGTTKKPRLTKSLISSPAWNLFPGGTLKPFFCKLKLSKSRVNGRFPGKRWLKASLINPKYAGSVFSCCRPHAGLLAWTESIIQKNTIIFPRAACGVFQFCLDEIAFLGRAKSSFLPKQEFAH